MSKNRKPRQWGWQLRVEQFEVWLGNGERFRVTFQHKRDMSTEATIARFKGSEIVSKGVGSTKLSKSDTYDRAVGKVESLKRAMVAAKIHRNLRTALWAIMPEIRLKIDPQVRLRARP